MSNISTTNINESFPYPGQDNDSVGFRNNFGEIKSALAIAKAELADLQIKAVLKSQLDVNEEFDNNLNGANINNGTHAQFYEALYSVSAVSGDSWPVDLNQGPVQQFILTQPSTAFDFINWTASINQLSKVRLMIKADTVNTYTITFARELLINSDRRVFFEVGFPVSLTVSGDELKVLDVWTINGGETIYVQMVGEF